MYKLIIAIILLIPIKNFAQYDEATKAKMRAEAIEALKTNEKIKIGKPMPPVAATDLFGTTVNNDSLKGKITIINVWYRNCGPCLREIPMLNKIVKKYNAYKNVQFWAFSLDDMQTCKKFTAYEKFDYRHFANCKKLIKDLRIEASPTHIIINEKGNVSFYLVGMLEDSKELTKEIDKSIKKFQK